MLTTTARPLRTGAAAVYRVKDHPLLGADFTWVDRFDEPYLAFRERGGYWYLPRAACPLGELDERATGEPADIVLKVLARDEDQLRVYDESTALLHRGRSHVVQASTGFGKTWVGCALATSLGVRTLVVVPKADLMGQWAKAFEKFNGIPPDEVGIIKAKTCRPGKAVTIASLKSVCKEGRYPAEVLGQFGLLLLDEVHRVAAQQFQGVCFEVPARLRIGLSATPERADGRDRLVQGHVGPVGVLQEGLPMLPRVLRYRTGFRVPRRNGRQIEHKPGRDMHLIKIMSRDPDRNRLILSLIAAAVDKGRHVVVFTHLHEHVEKLQQMVALVLPLTQLGTYTGKTTDLQAGAESKVVLATYGMAKDGTDFPEWDTCILATPLADARQAMGRVCRPLHGKKQPAVMDLIDDDSRLYGAYGEKRHRMYREKGADPIIDCGA